MFDGYLEVLLLYTLVPPTQKIQPSLGAPGLTGCFRHAKANCWQANATEVLQRNSELSDYTLRHIQATPKEMPLTNHRRHLRLPRSGLPAVPVRAAVSAQCRSESQAPWRIVPQIADLAG